MSIDKVFKNFILSIDGVIDIDDIPDREFCGKKPDYYLSHEKAVLEVKTISEDRWPAFKEWIHKKIIEPKEHKRGMPIIFGTMSLRAIRKGHGNPELFSKQLDGHAQGKLEEYVRKAKKQIRDGKAYFKEPSAIGVLVILNQSYSFYETGFVTLAIQRLVATLNQERPEFAIDGVYYINESHEGNPESVFIPAVGAPRGAEAIGLFAEIDSKWKRIRGNCA